MVVLAEHRLLDRQFLHRALKRHQGVVTHVADAIRMSRKNLYCRLTRLGIDPARFRPGRPFE